MLKAIHAQEDKAAARQKATLVAEKLRAMKLERINQRGGDVVLYGLPV